MTEIQVHGVREIVERMRAFPLKLQRRAVRAAVLAAAQIVARQVRADAPKLTGATRRNVVAKAGRSRSVGQTRAIIGIRHGKIKTQGSTVRLKSGGFKVKKLSAYDRRGQDPFYYRFQELGFMAVGRRRGGNGRLIPGRRFLTNALPKVARQAVDAMRATLAKHVDRAAR